MGNFRILPHMLPKSGKQSEYSVLEDLMQLLLFENIESEGWCPKSESIHRVSLSALLGALT